MTTTSPLTPTPTPTPLRRLAGALAALVLACLAMLTATASPADAVTRDGTRTTFSPEETAQMAAWLVDHGNMVGYVFTTASSSCGPTCYEGSMLWLAWYKDTVNQAARRHECVYVERFAPAVGGDSVPFVGIGCG